MEGQNEFHWQTKNEFVCLVLFSIGAVGTKVKDTPPSSSKKVYLSWFVDLVVS